MEVDYGILVIIPPLVAILLCFLTKRVLFSLIMGIFSGGLIMATGNPFAAFKYSLDSTVGSITDSWNANLLLFNLLMGAGVALIWSLGGSLALTNWAKKKIKNRNQASIGAWLLGIIVFINDYINAAIVGNVFRDIFDTHKVSKERLSYIVDSTAAPVATFFISDWIAFQIGMIQTGIDQAGITQISAFEGYLRGIPMNLYCIFAVVFVGIIIISKKDFGPMLKAEHRVMTTGKTYRDGANPMLDVADELGEAKPDRPMLLTFILPLVTLILVALFGFWWTGKGPDKNLMAILGDSDPAVALLWGAAAMTIMGAAIALIFRIMNVAEVMDTIIRGLKLMLLACAILVSAWTLGAVTGDMKLAAYLTKVVGGAIPFSLVPVIIFVLGCVIAFATGTSWGTMTIMTPIAIPLAYSMTGDPIVAVMMSGVVFSGAIFGDHCSPISDTTVLSSIFSGADHMDHVSTQIPYALTVASVAAVMFLLYGVVKITPAILIPLGLVLLVFIPRVLHRISARKYGITT
jgi:Na+/H+ antiporter NhaC